MGYSMISSLRKPAHRSLLDIDARPDDGPTSGGLRGWFWRSELLQVMFWLKDEGIGDQVDLTLLERFLGVDSYVDVQYLDGLVDEGYVERVGDRYKLSEAGARKGELEFVASFEELMRPPRRECGTDSWCHHCPDAPAR